MSEIVDRSVREPDRRWITQLRKNYVTHRGTTASCRVELGLSLGNQVCWIDE